MMFSEQDLLNRIFKKDIGASLGCFEELPREAGGIKVISLLTEGRALFLGDPRNQLNARQITKLSLKVQEQFYGVIGKVGGRNN
jgi:hypothetical protein